MTGLPIDPALLQERIFVARYGNEPAVNNYFGISAPDLVFEELMDSLNTTRFTTVWLGGDAPQIGPLRSFRSTTIQVAQMFDAPMASSGAVGPNQIFAYAAGIEDLDERCSRRPYFNNPSGGGYQNRVLTTSANLRAFLEANGLNTGVTIQPLTFGETPPSGGQPANRVVIPYPNRGFYEVEWRYDPATGRYARFSGSQRNPLIDGNNGQQVTAANVVIMEVAARPDRPARGLGQQLQRAHLHRRPGRAGHHHPRRRGHRGSLARTGQVQRHGVGGRGRQSHPAQAGQHLVPGRAAELWRDDCGIGTPFALPLTLLV